jgi:two-component system, LytTR family, sensor histidine kinase LytS
MLMQEVCFVVLAYTTFALYRLWIPKGHYVRYFLAGLAIWTIYLVFFAKSILYMVGDMPHLVGATWDAIFVNSATRYFFTFVLLTMAKYFKDNFSQQYFESQQKQLQMASELENLKAQVSPHFLFNTMNNFYGLAVERSEKLPELMVRLSDLLRYSLYETQHATVRLSAEIDGLRGAGSA